jgi:AcrR family transcriptional regulator
MNSVHYWCGGEPAVPRIIENLEQRVLEIAEKLFMERGYDGVNMRMIAKEAGIAVGTLYNYYSNKKDLLIKVFEKSWEGTFRKLDEIVCSPRPPREKISYFILKLYEEMIDRKGLGFELQKADAKNLLRENKRDRVKITKGSPRKDVITKVIREKVKAIIIEAGEENLLALEEGMEERLASAFVFLTWGVFMEYPAEKEKNLSFINQLIDVCFHTELTRPNFSDSIGDHPRVFSLAPAGQLILRQRAVKSSMDSTNIQGKSDPPLKEVSFQEKKDTWEEVDYGNEC